jgi:hypothetical protein
MKKIGIAILIILAVVLVVVLSIVGRGCETASRMADQTIFNADKHVWTFEEFYRKYEAYIQYGGQKAETEKIIAGLEEKGQTDTQRYNNLTNELDGCRNMMRRIATEYNKMSDVAYQAIWKDKNLPEKLGPELFDLPTPDTP